METKKLLFAIFLAIPLNANAADAFTCPGLKFVSRSGWGARKPDEVVWIKKPVEHIFICHTVTPRCFSAQDCSARMRQMQNFHMEKDYGDIGYNFVIGGDGRVYEGVGWDRVGAHTYGWNSKSFGIAFVGNFMEYEPSESMLRAARKLMVCGIIQGHIHKDRALHGARDGVCTLSPGDYLYDIIKHWPAFEGGQLDGYQCF